MRRSLATDPAVVGIAEVVRIDEFGVVGRLHAVWSWLDQHSAAGTNVRISSAFLDRLTACPGFADAMRTVGWLSGRDGDLTFPGYNKHNGNTAKNRAAEAKKKAEQRRKENKRDKDRDKCPDDMGTNVPAETGPEEEEEEDYKEDEEGKRASRRDPLEWAELVGFVGVTDADRSSWARAYPACAIEQNLARMHEWLKANPAKAKKRQWRRFVTNWLSRQQENGGDRGAGPTGQRKPWGPAPMA